MLIDSDFSHSHGSYGPTHLTEATLVGNGGEISPGTQSKVVVSNLWNIKTCWVCQSKNDVPGPSKGCQMDPLEGPGRFLFLGLF